MPTLGCKDTNFPSKKERNWQLFPFQKENLFFSIEIILFYYRAEIYSIIGDFSTVQVKKLQT